MLTIRMQRRGRTGHAQFRVVVQDSRFHPTSGRVVAYVGNYDPHAKTATLDSDKIAAYLANGAQPSDRVARLLTKEGVKLPDWYSPSADKKKPVRNPDKRRSTRPAGAPAPEPKPVEGTVTEEAASEMPAEPQTAVDTKTGDQVEPAAAENLVSADDPKNEAETATEASTDEAEVSAKEPTDKSA